ncbi:hypothetical protein BH10ACT2_BH10ACT2_08390 [soil metagenome]
MSDDHRFDFAFDPHDPDEPVGATAMAAGFVADSVWRRWWSTADADTRRRVAAGEPVTLTVPGDDGSPQRVAIEVPRWLCDDLAE